MSRPPARQQAITMSARFSQDAYRSPLPTDAQSLRISSSCFDQWLPVSNDNVRDSGGTRR
jgi:hypothetical protein